VTQKADLARRLVLRYESRKWYEPEENVDWDVIGPSRLEVDCQRWKKDSKDDEEKVNRCIVGGRFLRLQDGGLPFAFAVSLFHVRRSEEKE